MRKKLSYIASGFGIGLLADIPLYFIFSACVVGSLSGDQPDHRLCTFASFIGLWLLPPLGAFLGYLFSRGLKK